MELMTFYDLNPDELVIPEMDKYVAGEIGIFMKTRG